MSPDKSLSSKKPRRRARAQVRELWLFGTHTVAAALANPHREILRLAIASDTSHRKRFPLENTAKYRDVPMETVSAKDLATQLPPGATHQGIAALVRPLARIDLDAACKPASPTQALTVVLDQVTDPRNLGAVMRSAAVFGACAVVVQDRNSPAESGVLAKAASGALDQVPLVRTTNLARALEALAELSYWRVALDPTAEKTLVAHADHGAVALVLGAEGKGLRRLTSEHCDTAVRLASSAGIPASLNVSVAAAVALYEFRRDRGMDAEGGGKTEPWPRAI